MSVIAWLVCLLTGGHTYSHHHAAHVGVRNGAVCVRCGRRKTLNRQPRKPTA